MKFHSFALLAAIAPIAVQSHGTETRYCVTDEASPKLRIFIQHYHGPSGGRNPRLYTNDPPSKAGTVTFEEAGNPTKITRIPDFLVWGTGSDSLGSTILNGAACTEGTTTRVKTCGRVFKDWAVFDFTPTCDATYTIISGQGGHSLTEYTAGCPVNLYPSVIPAAFPCPSDAPSSSPSSSPSSQPSLVPSRSSKKGKKSWRLEREARDPNFPPKVKSGKAGHGTAPKSSKAP